MKFNENGLRPGEEVLAVATFCPENSFKKAYTRGAVGGGLFGALLTKKLEKNIDEKADVLTESEMSKSFPDGQLYVAVTNMRIILYGQNSLTEKFQGIVKEYSLGDLHVIDIIPYKLTKKVTVQFKDGGQKNFDVHWTMDMDNFRQVTDRYA